MLRSMAREASARGFGALYATYGAFMLKSIPYDVAELATYSQLVDWRAAAATAAAGGQAQRGGWRGALGTALAAMPESTGDLLIGATVELGSGRSVECALDFSCSAAPGRAGCSCGS
jgi:hypothetical protein